VLQYRALQCDLSPSIKYYASYVEPGFKTIDRNITSVYYCGLVCARQMAANGSGAIVVTSSQVSEVARPGMSHCTAAKGGVRQLVRAMAVDLPPYGIRVNAIASGPTLTPGNPAMFERPDVAEVNQRTIPRQGCRSQDGGYTIL